MRWQSTSRCGLNQMEAQRAIASMCKALGQDHCEWKGMQREVKLGISFTQKLEKKNRVTGSKTCSVRWTLSEMLAKKTERFVSWYEDHVQILRRKILWCETKRKIRVRSSCCVIVEVFWPWNGRYGVGRRKKQLGKPCPTCVGEEKSGTGQQNSVVYDYAAQMMFTCDWWSSSCKCTNAGTMDRKNLKRETIIHTYATKFATFT